MDVGFFWLFFNLSFGRMSFLKPLRNEVICRSSLKGLISQCKFFTIVTGLIGLHRIAPTPNAFKLENGSIPAQRMDLTRGQKPLDKSVIQKDALEKVTSPSIISSLTFATMVSFFLCVFETATAERRETESMIKAAQIKFIFSQSWQDLGLIIKTQLYVDKDVKRLFLRNNFLH